MTEFKECAKLERVQSIDITHGEDTSICVVQQNKEAHGLVLRKVRVVLTDVA